MAELGSLGERLDALREVSGEGITSFAHTLGVSRTTLYEWRQADEPTEKAVGAVISRFPNVNVRWLNTGEGEMLASTGEGAGKEEPAPPTGEAGVREMPVFGKASAGDGCTAVEEPIETTVVPVAEYRRVFGSRAAAGGQLGYWRVDGDSAAPVFFDEELVPVEMIGPTQEFTPERVYVFRWNEHFYIKRLIMQADKTIKAQSLNPAVEDFTFKPKNGHGFAVLGKVLQSPKQQLYVSLLGEKLISR